MKQLLFVVLFLLSPCFKGSDFKIIKSTSQDWAGGRPEAGRGTNYQVFMVAKVSSENLVVDKLWINQDYYEVKILRKGFNKDEVEFQKRDTIYVRATKLIKTDRNGDPFPREEIVQPERPFEYNGVAILGYLIKNKRKYKKIKELEKLKFIAYP